MIDRVDEMRHNAEMARAEERQEQVRICKHCKHYAGSGDCAHPKFISGINLVNGEPKLTNAYIARSDSALCGYSARLFEEIQ